MSGYPTNIVFLDRDGVINLDTGYTHKIEDFVLQPGVGEGLRALKQSGALLVVVTNQSGVGRGMYSLMDVERLHAHLQKTLSKNFGVHIDLFLVCPHEPKESANSCRCRKPSAYFLNQTIKNYRVEKHKCVIIGDRSSDIQCGKNADIQTLYMINSKYPSDAAADFSAKDFTEASNWWISQTQKWL